MKKAFIFCIGLFILKNSNGQDSVFARQDDYKSGCIHQAKETSSRYQYKTLFKKDAPVIALCSPN